MQHGEKQAAVYLFLKELSFPGFLTFLFLHQLRGAILLEGVKCRDQLWDGGEIQHYCQRRYSRREHCCPADFPGLLSKN